MGSWCEEVVDVRRLEEPQNQPEALVSQWCWLVCNLPVNRANDAVQGEGRVVGRILAPDGPTMVLPIMRGTKGVVDAGQENEKPRERCQNSPSQNCARSVFSVAGMDCYTTASVDAAPT